MAKTETTNNNNSTNNSSMKGSKLPILASAARAVTASSVNNSSAAAKGKEAVPVKAKKTTAKKSSRKGKLKNRAAAAVATAARSTANATTTSTSTSHHSSGTGAPAEDEYHITNQKRAGIPSYYDLHELFVNEKVAVKYLMDHGIVHQPRTTCPRCHHPIAYNPDAEFNVRCRSRPCLREHGKMWSESVFNNSCLFQSSKKAHVLLHFLYLWINGIAHKQIYIMLGWSTVTATTWIRYARQAVAEAVVPVDAPIGGEGTMGEGTRVEVGIVKMKSPKAEDQWLLAGLERNSRRSFFAVRLKDNDQATIVSNLMRLIRPGSTIISKEADNIPNMATTTTLDQHHQSHTSSSSGSHNNNIASGQHKYRHETFKDMIKKYPGETPMFEWIWRKQHEATLWSSLMDAMKDLHLTADQMKDKEHNSPDQQQPPQQQGSKKPVAAGAAANGGSAGATTSSTAGESS